MLDTIRENARSFAIQFAIALIAVVFIFSFGPGSRGCRTAGQGLGSSWAAKVNGEQVPASMFDQAYRQRVQLLRMRTGEQVTAEQARMARVREDAMRDIVERELVAQAAEREGLWVSDDDLARELQESTQFHKDGVFDPETYKKWVVHVEGLTPGKFEERLRRDLLARRMYQLVLGSVSVGEDEIRAEFLKENEGAAIRYVKFQPGQFRDQAQPTQAEIDQVLQTRAADIQKKYDENRALYTQKRGLKVKRIFVAVKQDATPEQEAAAKAKIQQAADALKGGEKFEDLAASVSEGPEAKSGGEVGWVSFGESPYGRQFEEAVFKLKVGETSDIVRDRFGFEILRVTEERPASEKKLAEVQGDIAKELATEEKAKTLARQAAQTTLDKLKAGEALAAQWPAAEKKEGDDHAAPAGPTRPEVAVTETFHPYGGIVPGLGSAPKVSAAAFALSADKKLPDAVVEDQNAFFVFELTSRTRADLAKLDDAQKATLRERLEGQRKADLRRVWAENLRKDASVEENASLLSYERKRAGVNEPNDPNTW